MKILHVTGDDDYSALNFECIVEDRQLTFEQASELGTFEDDNYEGEITVNLVEFREVDENFIHFVKTHMMDYDYSKSENFYTEQDEIFKHK